MNDVPVVERMDERVPRLRHHLTQAGLAVGERDAFLDDLRAERTRSGHLRGVRVLGDEDQRRERRPFARRAPPPARDCRSSRRRRLEGARGRISDSTALNAPRGLKEPVTWKHSGLSRSCGSRSVVRVGVRRTCGRMRSAAACTCSEVLREEIAQTAAFSFSRAACAWPACRRVLVSTMPNRMTTMPSDDRKAERLVQEYDAPEHRGDRNDERHSGGAHRRRACSSCSSRASTRYHCPRRRAPGRRPSKARPDGRQAASVRRMEMTRTLDGMSCPRLCSKTFHAAHPLALVQRADRV